MLTASIFFSFSWEINGISLPQFFLDPDDRKPLQAQVHRGYPNL
jgi:hypothetical protein